MALISRQDFAKAAKLEKFPVPGLAWLLMKLLKLDSINKLVQNNQHLPEGIEFTNGVLKELGITVSVSQEDLNNLPDTGAFIAVANHPYGGIEGLILLKLLLLRRSDAKVMVNFLLKKVKNLTNFFIGVNPFEDLKSVSSLSGMREVMTQLEAGSPIGIFPAGEVSTYQKGSNEVKDREWSPIISGIILKTKVPVVPIYFHGHNGQLFHLLGKINSTLRTAKLPSELFNKNGKTIKVTIGKPILPEEYLFVGKEKETAEFFKCKTYKLAGVR